MHIKVVGILKSACEKIESGIYEAAVDLCGDCVLVELLTLFVLVRIHQDQVSSMTCGVLSQRKCLYVDQIR